MARKKTSEEIVPKTEMTTSRRDAIKAGLAVLAGAGISALSPAVAYADTGNLQYGQDNNAGTAQTMLTSSNSRTLLQPILSNDTGATLALANTAPSSGTGLSKTYAHCLHTSQNNDSPTAVFDNDGAGAGLAAYSQTGYPISAGMGKANLYLTPASSAGAPTTGTHALGEIYTDVNGVLWTCTLAGTPGTWASLVHSGANAADVAVGAVTASGAANFKGATAVEGTFAMTRSGRKKISKGKASGSVTVPGGIAASANVICTLQNSAGSGVYVRYAKRTSATTFKIYLNKKATTSTAYVAWMVLG